jgi:hypothetical protein
LENKRKDLLIDKENECCLRSRSIWLEVKDENTKLFHRYENCKKSSNSIKKIERGDGSWDEKFGDIATIDVILRIFYYFTRFIDP